MVLNSSQTGLPALLVTQDGYHYYPHFTDEEPEAQKYVRAQVSLLRSCGVGLGGKAVLLQICALKQEFGRVCKLSQDVIHRY